MAGDGVMLHPNMTWAQRKDKIYLTINLEDVKDPQLTLDDNSLHFKGHGGTDKKNYEVTVNFFKEVNPKDSSYAVLDRNIPFVIKKKEDGPYWPRLIKEKSKFHWLKTDFSKWRDEDDSDAEEGDDMQFEDMMHKMGNFKTAGDNADPLQENEEDSDDEDLPDLE